MSKPMLNNERNVWQGKNIAFNVQGFVSGREFEKQMLNNN